VVLCRYAVRAVCAVQCFVTRAVRAVCAVRFFVTPMDYIFTDFGFYSSQTHTHTHTHTTVCLAADCGSKVRSFVRAMGAATSAAPPSVIAGQYATSDIVKRFWS